jgi:hypothetical protein
VGKPITSSVGEDGSTNSTRVLDLRADTKLNTSYDAALQLLNATPAQDQSTSVADLGDGSSHHRGSHGCGY